MARAALGGLLGGVFGGGGGDDGEAARRKYADTVALINKMESEVSALSDADLRARTAVLQERARAGDSLDSLLPVRTQHYNHSHIISYASAFEFSSVPTGGRGKNTEVVVEWCPADG